MCEAAAGALEIVKTCEGGEEAERVLPACSGSGYV